MPQDSGLPVLCNGQPAPSCFGNKFNDELYALVLQQQDQGFNQCIDVKVSNGLDPLVLCPRDCPPPNLKLAPHPLHVLQPCHLALPAVQERSCRTRNPLITNNQNTFSYNLSDWKFTL